MSEAKTSNDLAAYFNDDWYKFTESVMDEERVASIVAGVTSPDNKPHTTTTETLVKACREFMELNGEACERAVELLNTRKPGEIW